MCIDERALPQIVDRERGQNESEPRELDRRTAEMTEIGIERLRAGHGKKHGAERDEADESVMREKVQAVKRVERP